MTQPRRVVFAIGDVAGGHRSAAAALTEAFHAAHGDAVTCVTVDLFAHADPNPVASSDDSYRTISGSPALLWFHTRLWHAMNTAAGAAAFHAWLRSRTTDAWGAAIEAERPDLVVSIHPYTGVTLGPLFREQHRWRYATVITDLTLLDVGWCDPHAERLFSPSAVATAQLRARAIDADRIVHDVFPLQPKLRRYAPRADTLAALGLSEDAPVVLVTGGGIGASSLVDGVVKMADERPWQLIVVTGRNAEARADLERRLDGRPGVAVLGFVDNMQDYLHAADVVVGKPGPATILEIELFRRKGVLTQPIGPQEEHNVAYALESSAFRSVGDDHRRLPEVVDALLAAAPPVHARRSFEETDRIVAGLWALLQGA